jgi:hypothetical protein
LHLPLHNPGMRILKTHHPDFTSTPRSSHIGHLQYLIGDHSYRFGSLSNSDARRAGLGAAA